MKRYMKQIAGLSLILSLLCANVSFAYWVNENKGLGEAYWVEETAPGTGAAPFDAGNAQAGNGTGAEAQTGGTAAGTVQNEAVPAEQQPAAQPAETFSDDGAGTRAYVPREEVGPGIMAGDAEARSGGSETGGQAENQGAEAKGTAQTQRPAGTAENGKDPAAGADTDTNTNTNTAESDGMGAAANTNPNLVMSGGRQLDLTKPMIALTYDDGPLASVGNRIMDVMEQHGGRATFFMVGDRVKSYQTEVRRMAANGHEVANHTYSHTYLNKVDAAAIRAQVEQCNNVIQEVTGIRPSVMRLPGGNKNSTVLQNINMPIILWNIDTRDWSHRNVQKTVDAVLGKVKDGDIVLMHELYSSTASATEILVPKLVAEGYQLVTVSELARFKGKTLSPNQIYYSMR